MDRVASGVHERPAPEVPAVADVARSQQWEAEVRLEMQDRADLARVEDRPQPGEQRMVAIVEGLDEHTTRPLGGPGHRFCLGDARRERLLAEHVLARLERADGPLGVERVRQGIVDGLDLGIREERLVRFVDARNRVPGARARGRGQRRRARSLRRRGARAGRAPWARSAPPRGCRSGGARPSTRAPGGERGSGAPSDRWPGRARRRGASRQ